MLTLRHVTLRYVRVENTHKAYLYSLCLCLELTNSVSVRLLCSQSPLGLLDLHSTHSIIRVCLAMRILSVCLSHVCIVTKRKKDLSTFLHHTKDNIA